MAMGEPPCLDNRGLQPPEPMLRILAALETLPPGATLVALNDRQPLLLYPQLEELGCRYQTEPLPEGGYRVVIVKP